MSEVYTRTSRTSCKEVYTRALTFGNVFIGKGGFGTVFLATDLQVCLGFWV